MTTSRTPQISFTLGIIAWACAALWLVGPLLCSAERICGCLGHDQSGAGQARTADLHNITTEPEHKLSHGAEPSHSHHAGVASHEHGHNGKNKRDSNEAPCCSMIQALFATAKPVLGAAPVAQSVLILYLLNTAGENSVVISQSESVRPAKPRERVSTHEVCLDPAHRPIGPPSPSSSSKVS